MTETLSPAEQNAEKYADTILRLYREWADCETIQGMVMDVELTAFRSHTEFMLVLTTFTDEYPPSGGPGLKITGNITRENAPITGTERMEIQDLGTMWEEYEPEAAESDDWSSDDWGAALHWFAMGALHQGLEV